MAYGFNEDKSKVDLTYPLQTDFTFYSVICKYNSSENKYRIFIPIDHNSLYRGIQITGIYVSHDGQFANIDNYTALKDDTGLLVTFTSTVDFSGYLASVWVKFL